ncbi:hypothetical protein ACFPM7_01670 [Actinokineospora guangxiensis]|uniref:PPE family domain-containing protein n=1 Tax=Actinokineospora guangxiensis TaxID=1490288 RepID=A0ABW0EEC8_9PSEU
MAEHRWRGYEHPELYKMINAGPGPSASTPQTEFWDALLRELGEIDGDLNTKLGSLAVSWKGAAADGAQSALNPLQVWAAEAQGGASGMRASTEYQADMIARARAEVPEPVKVTTPAPSGWSKVAAGAALLTGNPGPAMAVANQASDHEAQERAKDEAAQKAVDAMDSYSRSSEFNRETLGEFVPPPDVVVSTPAPQGGMSAGVTHFTSATGGYTTGGSGSTAPSYAAPAPSGGSGYTPTVNTGGGSFTPVGSVTPGGPPPAGFTPVGTTTPAGYAPTQPAGPTGPGYAGPGALPPGQGAGPFFGAPGAGPSGGSAGTRGGFGARGGMPGGGIAPLPVEGESTRGNQIFRPGVGMAGEAGVGARGGAIGAVPAGSGARGGTGMGMAGPLGGAAGGDEDREHGLADYLIETVDVFGDERTVSQPVIGEDTDR